MNNEYRRALVDTGYIILEIAKLCIILIVTRRH